VDIAGDDDNTPPLDVRRLALADESVAQLVERVMTLEYELALVFGGARKPLCGDVHGQVSCQLFRGHEGLHAWGEPDGSLFIRWA
jgi:hypothetical protein